MFVDLAQWPGTGAEPISNAELSAWQTNMDVRLTPLESMAVRRLDVEWRVAQHDRPRTP